MCKWRIEKVLLLPFGGITIFNEKINHSLNKEFLIAILGPLLQIIFFIIFKGKNPLFDMYNNLILCFNLLPIVPLDGSKIVNIVSNKIISFKKSGWVTLVVSIATFVLLIVFSINKHNLLFLIVLVFIGKQIISDLVKQNLYFHKFLLERYLYNFRFKRTKLIKKIGQMQQEKEHYFNVRGKKIKESIILQELFDKYK